MNCLYTGFKGLKNSSFQLVNKFSGNKYFLTNSFSGIVNDIHKLNEEYDSVIMFGIDKTLHEKVRIEQVAEKDSDMVYTNADISILVNNFIEKKINYVISHEPTHYLCNEAYYQMLKKMTCTVLFIHIPTQKNMSDKLCDNIICAFEKYNKSVSLN